MTALIICSSSASRIPCSPPRSTISRSSSAVICASDVTSAPNRRVTQRVIAVSGRHERAEQPAEEVERTRQHEREPLVVGQREGLRHELGEHDREQREDHRDDDDRDEVRGPAVHAGARERLRQPVREAHGRERRCQEADDGEAELRDGEEPARVVEQAAHPARAGLALLHQLLDAAAPDRHERDLGGDEEALEDREDDQEDDRGDGVDHVAPPSVAGATSGASAVPGLPSAASAAGTLSRGASGSRIRAGTPTASLPGGHVPGDDRPGPGLRPVAEGHRRAEHRVDAEEDALSDRRAVLVHPVVVGRDRARADVGVLADVGVAQVAVVVLADVLAEVAVLELREVADLRAAAHVRARPQVAERADRDLVLHGRPLDDARPDHAVRADPRVEHLRSRSRSASARRRSWPRAG